MWKYIQSVLKENIISHLVRRKIVLIPSLKNISAILFTVTFFKQILASKYKVFGSKYRFPKFENMLHSMLRQDLNIVNKKSEIREIIFLKMLKIVFFKFLKTLFF